MIYTCHKEQMGSRKFKVRKIKKKNIEIPSSKIMLIVKYPSEH